MWLSRTEGGALVEFAVTLPLVMTIMTGIFAFSIVSFQKLELAQAIGTGGRVLAVDRGDTDPCATTTAAIYASAPSLDQSKLSLTYTLGGVSTGASCPGSGGAANANLVSGGNAEVTATYPCSLVIYGKDFGVCSLSSQITEIVQ